MSITALITANVFHNGLLKRGSWNYYTEHLRRLSTRSIDWHITDLDFDLAFIFWDLYGLDGSPAGREACDRMRTQLRICHLSPEIIDYASGFPLINYFDSLRLAATVYQGVDAIVTWEPMQFARTEQEYSHARRHRYFDLLLDSIDAESNSPTSRSVRVYSVDAFLLHFDQLQWATPTQAPLNPFCLEAMTLHIGDRHVQAQVGVRSPRLEIIQATACGITPCDALYQAIDQCVDHCLQLPRRHLIYFTIPGTIGGVDASTEVVIHVECGQRTFEASAHHPDVIRAFGEAYVGIINGIATSWN